MAESLDEQQQNQIEDWVFRLEAAARSMADTAMQMSAVADAMQTSARMHDHAASNMNTAAIGMRRG